MNNRLEVSEDEIEFMKQCNIHPHLSHDGIENEAKILTENDEGASLSKDDLLKLSDILFRYAQNRGITKPFYK